MEKTNNIGRVYRFKDGKYYKLVENEQPLCSGCVLRGKPCGDVVDRKGVDRWPCTDNLDSDGIGINCKFIASTREEYEEYRYEKYFIPKGKDGKAFNLEEAKAGKPVCTRDGRKARIICFDVKNYNRPIAALIMEDGSEVYRLFTSKGTVYVDHDSSLDLVMAPEKHEGWINIYPGDIGDMRRFDYIYPTEEEALKNIYADAESSRVATVKVEWEE